MIETVNLAIGAIFREGCEDFGLGVCDLPTRPFGEKIGRTFLTDVFRAAHYLPAAIFPFWKV